jgi:hypothetical protein
MRWLAHILKKALMIKMKMNKKTSFLTMIIMEKTKKLPTVKINKIFKNKEKMICIYFKKMKIKIILMMKY